MLSGRPMTESSREGIVSFVARTNRRLGEPWCRFVLDRVISGPERVCDLWRDGERVAVAVLVDTCSTQGNAAELSIFAPTGEHDVLAALLDWAEQICAHGVRDNLDVPAWPGGGVDGPWLTAHGFAVGYLMHDLVRSAGAAAPPSPRAPLPAGWAWRPLGEDLIASYHETVCAAFAELPGAYVSDLDSFARRALADEIPAELLCEPGEAPTVAAWIRVAARPGGEGELASLGRHPRHRGLGLGDHLVSRGIARLDELGVRQSMLEVAAVNTGAIALYQRHGYALHSTMAVYRRPVRLPPCSPR